MRSRNRRSIPQHQNQNWKTASENKMTVAEPKPLIPAATAAAFIELAKARRSVYTLSASSPVPDSEIQELVKSAILHVPSSFNTQSTRLVLLLHEEHRKLWDAAIKIFVESKVAPGKMSKEMWETHTKPKLQGFRAAYGTVRISSPLPFFSGQKKSDCVNPC